MQAELDLGGDKGTRDALPNRLSEPLGALLREAALPGGWQPALQAWLDGRLVINTSIKARTISLRPGDVEKCAPFGVATYLTEGKVRNLSVQELK